MSKAIYIECYSGISGDMLAGALIDLGADREALEKMLDSFPIKGFKTEITRVKKSGIDCCDFNVILEEDNHDHDMEYLYGFHKHHHDEHSYEHYHHHHEHHHDHDHEHHHHEHTHRNLADIAEIINNTEMSEHARKITIDIFTVLARAEAKAHGNDISEVHFHEVGAIDSIVDIAAIAVCFDSLDIDEVIVSGLYEGRGFVRCQHGVIPVPVPAVVNIAALSGLKLHITERFGEYVTPTGAAAAAALKTKDSLPEEFTVKKIGLGAGKREYKTPGMLRAMIIEY